jgi:hypothetical protein
VSSIACGVLALLFFFLSDYNILGENIFLSGPAVVAVNDFAFPSFDVVTGRFFFISVDELVI